LACVRQSKLMPIANIRNIRKSRITEKLAETRRFSRDIAELAFCWLRADRTR
jgi:hypothetical protein